MPYYYLEIVHGSESGRRFAIADGAISIGRSSRNTIAFPAGEKSVSGHHAILYKSPGRFMVQDLQSTNGTYVNGERVKEKDLAPGDEIGFGKMGPRLKLIESHTELAIGAAAPAPPKGKGESTRSKTVDDDRPHRARPERVLTQSEEPPDESAFEGAPASLTMEMERKLIERRASANDMHALLKNGKRLGKIVERGRLGDTQASILVSAFHASKKMRRQWYFILAAVIIVSLALVVFFAGRAYQYKRLLDRGVALEQKLDTYDKWIAEAKKDPEANRKRLLELIDKFEETGAEFASVRGSLREGDFQKFYADTVEELIADIFSRFGEANYHIPPEMVQRVKFHLGVYSGQLKGAIVRYLKRKQMYYPMICGVLKENNLPAELSYVAMLESGFNPKALSHAGARGMWQFMKPTGRRYGLRIDDYVDDRCDPLKATRAAAEYFKDLIGIFGGKSSVMFAMAAYNAGEGRVQGALRKIEDPLRNRDFWYIYRMGYLAEETNEYIPRVFALLIISENLGRYGFAGIDTVAADEATLEAENDFVEIDLGAEYDQTE